MNLEILKNFPYSPACLLCTQVNVFPDAELTLKVKCHGCYLDVRPLRDLGLKLVMK